MAAAEKCSKNFSYHWFLKHKDLDGLLGATEANCSFQNRSRHCFLNVEDFDSCDIFFGVSTPSILLQQSMTPAICIDTHFVFSRHASMLTHISFIDRSCKAFTGAFFLTKTVNSDVYACALKSYIKAVRHYSEELFTEMGNIRRARKSASWFPYKVAGSNSFNHISDSLPQVRESFNGLEFQHVSCFSNVKQMVWQVKETQSCISKEIYRSFLADLEVIRRSQTRSIWIRSWTLLKHKWYFDEDHAKVKSSSVAECQKMFQFVFDKLRNSFYVSDFDKGYVTGEALNDGWAAFKRLERKDDWRLITTPQRFSVSFASEFGVSDSTFFLNPPVLSTSSACIGEKVMNEFKKFWSPNCQEIIPTLLHFLSSKESESALEAKKNFRNHPVPDFKAWKFTRSMLNFIEPCDPLEFKEALSLQGCGFFDDRQKAPRILFYHNQKKISSKLHFLRYLEKLENPERIDHFEELESFQNSESLSSLPSSFEELVCLCKWRQMYRADLTTRRKIAAKKEYPFLVEPCRGGAYCTCLEFQRRNVCGHILLAACALYPELIVPPNPTS